MTALVIAAVIVSCQVDGLHSRVTCEERAAGIREVPSFAELQPLPLGVVTAEGWMRESLVRCRDGFGGHFGSFDPDQFEKPYTTHDYDAKIPGAKLIGESEMPGWCSEMAGEYQLGRLELAATLSDERLMKSSRDWIDSAIALQENQPDGYLGAYRPQDNKLEDYNAWGAQFAYRAMLLEYSRTGDRRILEAVHKGLLWFCRNWSGNKKTDYVGPTILWPMVETYLLTGDKNLLTFAEDYARYLDTNANYDAKRCRYPSQTGGFSVLSTETEAYHVVAYAVRAQLPGILSLANGDKNLLAASVRAYDEHVRKVGWQVTGAPRSAMERTAPPSCTGETEYCNFICWMEYMQWLSRLTGEARFGDAIERMMFNAAMGARKKDELAIAYSSCPNQFNATKTSAREGWMKYYGAYTPCLFAACCPAQAIRLVPSYLSKAVMRAKNGDLVINTYGPYCVKAHDVTIFAETAYPFEMTVRLKIKASRGWTGALRLRRPCWAEDVMLTRNGKHIDLAGEKRWINVQGPWKDDVLTVTFVTTPRTLHVADEHFATPFAAYAYGPLVFAQPIDTVWTPVKDEPTNRQLPEGWPWYEARPARATPVYAAMSGARPVVKHIAGGAYPWDASPLRLAVPMVRASAAYPENPGQDGSNPAPLANPVVADPDARPETVELVPVGSTNLRLTCFPVARSVDCSRITELNMNNSKNKEDKTP